MCRFLAYCGPSVPVADLVIKPSHSLIEQSRQSTEAKLATNGDGFGLAWYGADRNPGRFVDVTPAWSDSNLPDVCRLILSKVFLAHVRASTVGATTRANCHPFTHDRWSFMHNGQIGGFAKMRRALETRLPDDLYLARRGDTDSELLFLLMLAHGLDQDPSKALQQTLLDVEKARSVARVTKPTRLSLGFSNGTDLFAFRWASTGVPPTLYTSTDIVPLGRVIASEPLETGQSGWEMLPANELCRFTQTGVQESSGPLLDSRQAA